ncbi:MAG: NAD(+)/NADH kinase [Lachnospiraceae bacterium]
MNRFIILANPDKDENLTYTNTIRDYLNRHGCECSVCTERVRDNTISKYLQNRPECAIIIGGDGTILQAATELVKYDMPMIGVNVGHLGFLTEIEPGQLIEKIDALLADEYEVEERMLLEGFVAHEDRKTKPLCALNDVVISRTGFSRIIQLRIYVNEELMDIYEADGVIVSTPTGSTGYNLAAGGPIVNPRMESIVVTPISPHSLSARSIVLSPTDQIRIEIGRVRKTQPEEAAVTFDGDESFQLEPCDVVHIACSKQKVKLLTLQQVSFYEIVRNKLGKRS